MAVRETPNDDPATGAVAAGGPPLSNQDTFTVVKGTWKGLPPLLCRRLLLRASTKTDRRLVPPRTQAARPARPAIIITHCLHSDCKGESRINYHSYYCAGRAQGGCMGGAMDEIGIAACGRGLGCWHSAAVERQYAGSFLPIPGETTLVQGEG